MMVKKDFGKVLEGMQHLELALDHAKAGGQEAQEKLRRSSGGSEGAQEAINQLK